MLSATKQTATASRCSKPNRNARLQGLRNMLANESLFLPTVDLAIDFLPVAHMQIMLSKAKNISDDSKRP